MADIGSWGYVGYAIVYPLLVSVGVAEVGEREPNNGKAPYAHGYRGPLQILFVTLVGIRFVASLADFIEAVAAGDAREDTGFRIVGISADAAPARGSVNTSGGFGFWLLV